MSALLPRREFIRGMTALPLIGGSACKSQDLRLGVPAGQSSKAGNPDAALFDLDRRRAAADIVFRRATAEADSLTFAGVPELPETLYVRASDYEFGFTRYASTSLSGRRWYWPESHCARGLHLPQQRNAVRAPRPSDNLPADATRVEYRAPWPEAQARADEILAAYAAWAEARDRANEASGYLAAEELAGRYLDKLSMLECELMAATPLTLAGLAVKAAHLRRSSDEGNSIAGFAEDLVHDILTLAGGR